MLKESELPRELDNLISSFKNGIPDNEKFLPFTKITDQRVYRRTCGFITIIDNRYFVPIQK